MVMLFRITRTGLLFGGSILAAGGIWYWLGPVVYHVENPLSPLGIFPLYIGGMLILIAAAMKEDWFTNARRYW
jgi:predicted membrane channel-forming protein YqfA (hemolysin III family)